MRINTNIASLNAQVNGTQTNSNLTSSLEKLSSGLKINKAADDASGMAIADKLRTQASSLGQGISNANSGTALIQIADKAMAEQSNILDIVKTKLIQAATSTTSAEGREAIRKDVQKLLTQFDNISEQTNYNGINLLNERGAEFNFQVGEDASFDIGLQTAYAVNTTGLGAAEGSSSDEDSLLGFGTLASSLGISGKSDITVLNGSTTLGTTSFGAISINNSVSAAVFGASTTAVTTSFSIEAENVTKLVLQDSVGSQASAVTITTDDANMIAMLDGISNTSLVLTGSDGTYQWMDIGTTHTDGGNGVLDFGQAVDISNLTFSNVKMSSNTSNSNINVVTEGAVKITQTATAKYSLAVDTATLNTQNAATLTQTMYGSGSSSADGIVFSTIGAGSSISLREGTTTVKVDQSVTPVTNASVAIGGYAAANTLNGNAGSTDGAFTITADKVEKITLGTNAGSVTITSSDANTVALLSSMASFDTNLIEVSTGTYMFAGTGGGTTELDFGSSGVDLKNVSFSGVDMATEGIYVQTDEAVSVTKNGSQADQDISISAATGTTLAGGQHLVGVKTDVGSVSGSLSGLKGLAEGSLTADVANSYMANIDAALTQLNSVRSDFGSTQGQLEVATRNMMVTKVNIQAAQSVIRDVDYAAESANFNKQNIIAQAGTYAMSQANAMQQNVLRLLQ